MQGVHRGPEHWHPAEGAELGADWGERHDSQTQEATQGQGDV